MQGAESLTCLPIMTTLRVRVRTDEGSSRDTRPAVRPWRVPRATSTHAPTIWLVESVLGELLSSAARGSLHREGGQLLGYWVEPYREAVVADWTGFAAGRFKPGNSSDRRPTELPRPRGVRPALVHPLRVPVGTWTIGREGDAAAALGRRAPSRPPMRFDGDDGAPSLLLVVEDAQARRVRSWMSPRRRWPWDILRRPHEAEVRPFVPPGTAGALHRIG